MDNQLYLYDVTSYECIDGDSCRVTIDLGFNASLTMICRLYGIDTPEKNKSAAGMLVFNYVESRLKGAARILVKSIKKDKYAGRFCGIIYLDGKSLNEELLELGYAASYFGASKAGIWTESKLKAIADKLTP